MPNNSKSQDIKCPRKALVSYLWITIFAGFAGKYGADNIKTIIDSQGFFPLFSFVVPTIFFITLIRFSIGNILHLRALEEKDSPSSIWVFDFLVILLESITFLLLGAYSYGNNLRFFLLLMVLFFIDFIWIATMPIQGKNRPKIPWSWGALNGFSALILVGIIISEFYYKVAYSDTSEVVCFLFVWFIFCAIIDLYLDHYNLWRIKNQKTSQPSPSS